MKTTLLLFVLILTSCSTKVQQPTPFQAGDQVIELQGCKQLQKEVDDYNKTHSDKKVADC